jgi:hypothetical protein
MAFPPPPPPSPPSPPPVVIVKEVVKEVVVEVVKTVTISVPDVNKEVSLEQSAAVYVNNQCSTRRYDDLRRILGMMKSRKQVKQFIDKTIPKITVQQFMTSNDEPVKMYVYHYVNPLH